MRNDLLKIARVLTIIFGILLIFTIIIPILNFMAASKIKRVEDGYDNPDSLLGWAIYLIVFGFVITGILVLIAIYADDLKITRGSSIEDKLNSLNKLYDNGLISKEEYDERRKKIIDSDL